MAIFIFFINILPILVQLLMQHMVIGEHLLIKSFFARNFCYSSRHIIHLATSRQSVLNLGLQAIVGIPMLGLLSPPIV